TDALRAPRGAGQMLGEYYRTPPVQEREARSHLILPENESISAAIDLYYSQLEAEKRFDRRVNDARNRLRKNLSHKRKLKANFETDLERHGDPEQLKRLGDLLLANITSATREGKKLKLIDYYSDNTPSLELVTDENVSVQELAARQFRQYTKAKRAREELRERLSATEQAIVELETLEEEFERLIKERDKMNLEKFIGPATPQPLRVTPNRPKAISGVRRYVSTDGYEILVGRGARDNDNLTFRLARPHDLWLHAGDYPGSHVIVRNPSRKEIPQRTLIEAAQLAGRFSQASEEAKVVVHYTDRKFLAKPKGAAPGIVRMSSFRSITVEPKESVPRFK
ncbi:MAG: NFACT RNA binding domain-containing protein, partial [Pyrinomonadaceae bacterium]